MTNLSKIFPIFLVATVPKQTIKLWPLNNEQGFFPHFCDIKKKENLDEFSLENNSQKQNPSFLVNFFYKNYVKKSLLVIY